VTGFWREDSFQAGSVDRPRPISLGIVFKVTSQPHFVAKHTSPLLHGFVVVSWKKSSVCAAVVNLHLWADAIVVGVHVEDYLGPCLGSCIGLAIGARGIPGVDSSGIRYEAAGGNTRVDDGGFEDIWVCGSQDVLQTCEQGKNLSEQILTYCHHGTTARTSNKNLFGVRLVLRQGPLDHVGNGVAVTPTLMCQRLLAADVPASSFMWRAGIDDNEAILLGQSRVGSVVEVGLCCSRAVMNRYNDTGRRSKRLWLINVETCFGRSSEIGNLGQAAGRWRALSETDGGGDGEVAREGGEEAHCGV
jgi:hypothetical protein